MTGKEQSWRKYEKQIFQQLKEWAGADARVEFDQKILGKGSGIERHRAPD